MSAASDIFGVSYGFINVLLFIILQPLAILGLAAAYVCRCMERRKSAIVCFAISLLMVLLEIICLVITLVKMQ